MTPLQMGILLHYCTTPGPHPMMDVDAYKDGAADLEREGALRRSLYGNWSATIRGRAWLEAACRTEPPRAVWVDAVGHEIMPVEPPP